MATFHQQHQRVQNQINGETIHVHEGHRLLVEKIDGLISRAAHENDAEAMVPVRGYLEQARTASTGGDPRRAVELLRRAAEVAGPAAAIATAIATVVQGLQ
ncbi:hypothetical protein [Micromonospora sp. NPDC049799]|uniref:hypothetical protein n=1 Tax=Micromonospora sp. NPDC049799 TaxID=3154741 RepID=UPI0033FB3282